MPAELLTKPSVEARFSKERERQSPLYREFREDVIDELTKSDRRIQEALNFLEEQDPKTYRHSIRVGMLPAVLAAKHPENIPDPLRDELAAEGATHDCGKGCSHAIQELIHSDEVLQPSQRAIVGQHTELGSDFLAVLAEDGRPRPRQYEGEDGHSHHSDLLDGCIKTSKYHHSKETEVDDPTMNQYDWHKVYLAKVADVTDALCDPERDYRKNRETIDSAQDAYEIVKKVLPEGVDELFGLDVEYIVSIYWDQLQSWHSTNHLWDQLEDLSLAKF